MKTKASFILLIVFLLSVSGQAQSIKKWKYADLEQFINQSKTPIVINFWATFCKPCVEEIPYFQKLVSQLQDKKVKLLLASIDFPEYFPEKIEAFAKKNGFTAEIVWMDEDDPGQFCPKIDANWSGVLPATLFINKKMNYRSFHSKQLSEVEMKEELQKLTK
ncbi:MAG TPA: TlpA disulfide reductase family protein [Chitinophagaceae bacterium]|nr:TlpA disulfide reductase family protein [Chitinophagaceae bacterium]